MDFNILYQFGIIIFSAAAAFTSVKIGLNGTKKQVEEHSRQMEHLIKTDNEHNTKIAVLETKLTNIEQGIQRIEQKLQ